MKSEHSSTHSRQRNWPVLALSMGDMNGIGPEVILRVLSQAYPLSGKTSTPVYKKPCSDSTSDNTRKRDEVSPADLKYFELRKNTGYLIMGSEEVFFHYARQMGISPFWQKSVTWTSFVEETESDSKNSGSRTLPGSRTAGPGEVMLVNCPYFHEPVQPGHKSAEAGRMAMQAVDYAVKACRMNKADAVVTAPISKETIHMAGFRVPGHTEYLAELTGTLEYGMLLINPVMRMGLASIHLPVAEISRYLTSERLIAQIRLYHRTLLKDFGLKDPRVSVLGLNPHAGDGGVLGNEEAEIIHPAIETLKNERCRVEGPFPADGFFGTHQYRETDLIIAMYHDQGLIPFKMSGFGAGVNMTAGLPFIRTSPDHGTAFPIAGRNIADAGSMKAAIALAANLCARAPDHTLQTI